MAIDAEFLSRLVSPRTRRPLRVATTDELEAVNERIRRGDARNAGGSPVTDPLTEGLVPDGERLLFPVADGIPVLLAEEALPLDAADPGAADSAVSSVREKPES